MMSVHRMWNVWLINKEEYNDIINEYLKKSSLASALYKYIYIYIYI